MKPTIALNNVVGNDVAFFLNTILGSLDFGVLVTDLNHQSLAVNERFGEIFCLDLRQTVDSDKDAVRDRVKGRIADFPAWQKNLDQVYADPLCTQTDILELSNPTQVLLRKTQPVLGRDGKPFARIWTFKDLTEIRVAQEGDIVAIGNCRIDVRRRELYVRDEAVPLTQTEYDVLAMLVKHRPESVSRDDLYRAVWGYESEYASNTLDVVIYRMRNKIKDAGGDDIIATVRGVGFRLRAN